MAFIDIAAVLIDCALAEQLLSLDALVFRHATEGVLAIAIEAKKVVVVLPESVAMGHGDQSDTLLLHVRVEVSLDVDGHSGGALVEDSVEWLMVDEARHSDALLFTTRKNIRPVVERVPSTLFALDDVGEANIFHDHK